MRNAALGCNRNNRNKNAAFGSNRNNRNIRNKNAAFGSNKNKRNKTLSSNGWMRSCRRMRRGLLQLLQLLP